MEVERYGPKGDTLREAILALPELERVVLSLHYFEARTDAQIALILERDVADVTRIRERSIAIIRTTLQ